MHGLAGAGTLMRIHIGERDKYDGKPLHAVMGYGATARLHTDSVLRLSLDLPIVVECVDAEEKIQAVLPDIDAMMGGGLITLERVRVIAYRGHAQ